MSTTFSYEYLQNFLTDENKIKKLSKNIKNFDIETLEFYINKLKQCESSEHIILFKCVDVFDILLNYIKKDSCLDFYYKISKISKSEEDKYTKAFSLVMALDKVFENKNNFEEREEGKKMKMNMGTLAEKMMENYMPSSIADDSVALSMSGVVVVKRKNGDYVRYNSEQKKIVNEMNLVLNNSSISKTILLMPTNQILEGDVIRENSTYYYVLEPKSLKCVNLSTGKISVLVDETNMITGNKIFHKVTSLFSMQANGTLNPMLLCYINEDSEDKDNSSDLFTMMAMTNLMGNATGNQNTTENNMFQNPMMMYMMMGSDKGSSNDVFKFMMLLQMMGNNQSVNLFNPIKS